MIDIQNIQNYTNVLSHIGGLIALLWAIYAYFKGIRKDKTAQFKENTATIPSHFGEISYLFETQAIQIIKSTLPSSQDESNPILKLLLESLDIKDQAKCLSFLDKNIENINHHIAFSLPAESIDLSMSKRIATETAVSKIAQYSNSAHLFLKACSNLTFDIYRHKFGVDRLHVSVNNAIFVIWQAVHSEKLKDTSTSSLIKELKTYFLYFLQSHSKTTKIMTLLGQLDGCVKQYVDYHIKQSDRKLWKIHHNKRVHLKQENTNPIGIMLKALKAEKPLPTELHSVLHNLNNINSELIDSASY